MSITSVTTGSHRNHAWCNQRAIVCRPYPSVTLGKLVLPLTGHCHKRASPNPHGRAASLRRDSPALYHGFGRTSPDDEAGEALGDLPPPLAWGEGELTWGSWSEIPKESIKECRFLFFNTCTHNADGVRAGRCITVTTAAIDSPIRGTNTSTRLRFLCSWDSVRPYFTYRQKNTCKRGIKFHLMCERRLKYFNWKPQELLSTQKRRGSLPPVLWEPLQHWRAEKTTVFCRERHFCQWRWLWLHLCLSNHSGIIGPFCS